MIYIHYTSAGEERRGSLTSLLTQEKVPSTRMMKYLIAQTELLVGKGLFDAKDLNYIAKAYEVSVTVHKIVMTGADLHNPIDITPKELPDGSD